MSFFTLAQAGFSVFGVFAAFVSALAFGRGRQLRRRGEILLPALENASTWTTETKQLDLTDDVTIAEDVRPALAAQWRENGRSEHASVAAFARLTLDLVALGAPPALIADAQRDALDEIRHAELCFSLAEGLDGRAVSPGAFREAQTARTLPSMRTPALATLAVDSLIDGALHEGVSAAVVAELARRTEVPTIRDMLVEIARDEGRHAAHGWDVALWCIDQGGELVLAAVRGALVGLPKTMNTNLPAEAKSGAWERYGIMGEELEREAYARMLVNLERRVARLGERTDWRMQA